MKELDSFPKVSLGVFPTPVQRLDRISAKLDTNVYIKRDDLTGLGLGAKLFLPGTKVYGMMVDTDPFDEITPALMRETAALLKADIEIREEDYHLMDMCGPGYAVPSEEGNEAISLIAREEGLFLDPVYTGKAFAGLLKMAAEGIFRKSDNVLFLHSGGVGGLFAIL